MCVCVCQLLGFPVRRRVSPEESLPPDLPPPLGASASTSGGVNKYARIIHTHTHTHTHIKMYIQFNLPPPPQIPSNSHHLTSLLRMKPGEFSRYRRWLAARSVGRWGPIRERRMPTSFPFPTPTPTPSSPILVSLCLRVCVCVCVCGGERKSFSSSMRAKRGGVSFSFGGTQMKCSSHAFLSLSLLFFFFSL